MSRYCIVKSNGRVLLYTPDTAALVEVEVVEIPDGVDHKVFSQEWMAARKARLDPPPSVPAAAPAPAPAPELAKAVEAPSQRKSRGPRTIALDDPVDGNALEDLLNGALGE